MNRFISPEYDSPRHARSAIRSPRSRLGTASFCGLLFAACTTTAPAPTNQQVPNEVHDSAHSSQEVLPDVVEPVPLTDAILQRVERSLKSTIEAREQAAMHCAESGSCQAASSSDFAPADVQAVLKAASGNGRRERARRLLAGLFLDQAVEPIAFKQRPTRLALSFSQKGATFLLADLPRLLAEAPPGKRAGLLAAAAEMGGDIDRLDLEVQNVRNQSLAKFGVLPKNLIAARVSLQSKQASALAQEVLEKTDPVMAKLALLPVDIPAALMVSASSKSRQRVLVAGGAKPSGLAPLTECYVPNGPSKPRLLGPDEASLGSTASERFSQACSVQLKNASKEGLPDVLWVRALARLAQERSAQLSAQVLAQQRRAEVISLRLSALQVIESFSGTGQTPAQQRDSEVSRGTQNAIQTGASLLVPRDARGAASVDLATWVLAAAIDLTLTTSVGATWPNQPDLAPQATQALARLQKRWEGDGWPGLLQEAGYSQLSAQVLLDWLAR